MLFTFARIIIKVKVLLVHPSALMQGQVFLRLEPLGLERIARALHQEKHHVRILDLQIFSLKEYRRELDIFKPEAVGISMNYLANLPETIELAIAAKRRIPQCFVFVGGHSASFVAADILAHAGDAIDCVVKGEGEAVAPRILELTRKGDVGKLPGVVTSNGEGPPPALIPSIDDYPPLRKALRRRNKYFMGDLDPCASIEFSRGCPWHCSFCSGWTFYGRSYRTLSPEAIIEDLATIREPNVFVVDDVVFIHPEHAFAIGQEIRKRGIRKRFYMETRCDVLVRNQEVFRYWKEVGLSYMFLGLEAVDEERLKLFRKGVSLDESLRALEIARKLGIRVAINIIADSEWDETHFARIREWGLSIPEIVNLTVNTPYPGTESWHTETRPTTTLDYRLFDVQHAVLKPRLPLERFYEELVQTQLALYKKHMDIASLRKTVATAMRLLLHGQTNYIRMYWNFGRIYNAQKLFADHLRPVQYAMTPPPRDGVRPPAGRLYIHRPGAAENKTARPLG
jgi:hopanoid C-3 methylase HpnR